MRGGARRGRYGTCFSMRAVASWRLASVARITFSVRPEVVSAWEGREGGEVRRGCGAWGHASEGEAWRRKGRRGGGRGGVAEEGEWGVGRKARSRGGCGRDLLVLPLGGRGLA